MKGGISCTVTLNVARIKEAAVIINICTKMLSKVYFPVARMINPEPREPTAAPTD